MSGATDGDDDKGVGKYALERWKAESNTHTNTKPIEKNPSTTQAFMVTQPVRDLALSARGEAKRAQRIHHSQRG